MDELYKILESHGVDPHHIEQCIKEILNVISYDENTKN
jgi:hypothetical protein